MILFSSGELVTEAHTLCSQLEHAMQDTIKEQDQSLRVTGCVNPHYSVSVFSPANQKKKTERQSSVSSVSVYA